MLPGPHPQSARICAPVTIPALNGRSKLEYWLALAEAEVFTLPVKAKTKHPGSIVGKGWQFQSSRHPAQIQEWNRIYPNAAIGIHTGASGLVIADLDIDEIPEELAWLRTGLFQSSRGGYLEWDIHSDRGHYVFASDTVFVSGKLKLKDGTVVGEIRSGNSIILTQPSQHTKRDCGGEYRWMTTGLVPTLPDAVVALGYLTVHPGEAQRTSEMRCGATYSAGYLADDQSTDEEIREWALTQFNDGCAEATCDAIRNALFKWISAIGTEEASYPNLSGGHFEILNLGAEGHTGWKAACGELDEIYYVEVVEIRTKRPDAVVRGEIRRSYLDALRKMKGKVEQAAEIDAIYTPTECLCIRRKRNSFGFRPVYQPAYRPAYRQTYQLKWNH